MLDTAGGYKPHPAQGRAWRRLIIQYRYERLNATTICPFMKHLHKLHSILAVKKAANGLSRHEFALLLFIRWIFDCIDAARWQLNEFRR